MTKYVYAKMASIAAMISSATLLSGCETSNGRPEVCDPNHSKTRCAIVKPKAVAHHRYADRSHY